MKVKYYEDKIEQNEKSIVLCGPTPREEHVKGWRPEAINLLEELGFDGVVYIPEYKGSNKFYTYEEQVNWERNVYLNCLVMVFWVPRYFPDMPALTTNVEFGYWLKTGKCVYGRPDDSERNRYLDWLYKLEYNKKPCNKLRDLLKNAIILANESEDKNEKYNDIRNL